MVQPAAPTRAQEANEERAFRGIDRSIETWLGVIPEQRREDGYVIDFKVGQSFGEAPRAPPCEHVARYYDTQARSLACFLHFR